MTDGYSDAHKDDISTVATVVKKADIKCPHCKRGDLLKTHFSQQLQSDMYVCNVCGRGWHQDKKGRWHSHFAADVEVYSKNGHTLIDSSTWHINEGK